MVNRFPCGRRCWASALFGAAALAVTVRIYWNHSSPHPNRPLTALASNPAAVAREPPKPADVGQSLVSLPLTPRALRRAHDLSEGVDATEADWPTEAFSERASKQLKRLAALTTTDWSADQIASIVAPSCRCQNLRPADTHVATQSPTLRVLRRGPNLSDADDLPATTALRALVADVQSEARMAFKIVHVEAVADGYNTLIHAEAGGQSTAGRKQWTATWEAVWSDERPYPLIKSIRLADYEEVEALASHEPWLIDVTGHVLGKSPAYTGQLLYGMEYWVNRLEQRLHVFRLGHNGIAVGDVDGDGLEDLYVCQPGGLPNRLFLHQTDGTAIDVAAELHVDLLDDSTAALFVDLDNDADPDLVVLTSGGAVIFDNRGADGFEMRAFLPDCRNAFSLSAVDYDQDGRLDLYIGRYWPADTERRAIPLPVPYYDALNGGQNILLQNVGEWQFRDATEETGLNVDNSRYTMAAAWEDYDNDGDQDLYVANDFGRNCLYRNEQGRFVNIAEHAGVEDTANGMSVSWSDVDHNGSMDIYVGNMFSSAGNRITYQRQYAERFDETARQKLQRLARGNSLFSNQGNGTFQDVSVTAAVTMGRWAWGSMFVDLNNDSWDDLAVANGYITTEDTGDL